MSKITDIILISTISFGSGWIFGPQIVHWVANKIDDTVPKVKEKLDQAKKEGNKDMKDKKEIPQENIITVQDFGSCGYWTFDIKNKLNLPTQLVSIKGKWYIGSGTNKFLNVFNVKNNQYTLYYKDNQSILLPEHFNIKIVEGTDYYLKNYILPPSKTELVSKIVNLKNNIDEKKFNENKKLQELIVEPYYVLDEIYNILKKC